MVLTHGELCRLGGKFSWKSATSAAHTGLEKCVQSFLRLSYRMHSEERVAHAERCQAEV